MTILCVQNLHNLHTLVSGQSHVLITSCTETDLNLQEFDTSVYKLDCNLLKTVEVPEPVPEVEMTNEAAAGSSQVEDTKLSDQSEEVQNDKLAGI